MSDAKETVAQRVGEIAGAAVEQAAQSAEAAVEAAVARAEVAEELNEELTEAALRSKLGERITELEDEIDQWQETLEGVTADLSQLRALLTEQQATIAAQALLIAALETSRQNPQASIPPMSSETPNPSSETVVVTETPSGTVNPNSPLSEEGDGQKAPVAAPKTRRYRLT